MFGTSDSRFKKILTLLVVEHIALVIALLLKRLITTNTRQMKKIIK